MTEPLKIAVKGEPLEFETPVDVRNWLDSHWQPYQQYAGSVRNQPAARQAYSDAVQLLGRADISQEPGLQATLNSKINNFFQFVPLIDSTEGAFFRDLTSVSTETAQAGFAFYKGEQVNDLADPRRLSGVLTTYLWMNPVDDRGYRAASKALEAKAQSAQSDLEEKLAVAVQDLRDHMAGGNQWFGSKQKKVQDLESQLEQEIQSGKDWHETLKSWVKKIETQAESMLQRYKDEADALIATYDSKLALQAPATYWEAKATYHKTMTRRFGLTFAVFTLGCIALVAFLTGLLLLPPEQMFTTLGFSSLANAAAQSADSSHSDEIIKVATFGVIVAILLWVLRLLIRNLMSHQHLAVDAEERRMMIVTYISLLRDQMADREHSRIALETVFRPTADGFVKDDSGPTPWLLDLFRRT